MRRRQLLMVLATCAVVPTAPQRGHADEPFDAPTVAGRIDDLVEQHHHAGLFSGVALVSRHGEVIYERAFGMADYRRRIPNTTDTVFHTCSVGKAFVAVVVLQLVEEGRIDLDATVEGYLPELPERIATRVTVRQLLEHTSGLPRADWRTGRIGMNIERTTEQLVRLVGRSRLDFEPGTQWRYSNAGYMLLAAIIESVTGEAWGDVVASAIFEPAGMTAACISRDGTAEPGRAVRHRLIADGQLVAARPVAYSSFGGSGQVSATAADLYRFDRAMAGEVLLGPEMSRLMHSSSSTPPTWALGDGGHGWMLADYPHPRPSGQGPGVMTWHDGRLDGADVAFARLLDDGHCIVLLSNQTSPVIRDLRDGIARLLAGLPAEPPDDPIGHRILRALLEEGPVAADALLEQARHERRHMAPRRAVQATGPPDCTGVGGIGATWMPSARRQQDWIELEYAPAGVAAEVHIHGMVLRPWLTRLTVWDRGGVRYEIAPGDLTTTRRSHLLTTLSTPIETREAVARIRIELDTRDHRDAQILVDAVGYTDTGGAVHWASKATSSSAATRRFEPRNAFELPDEFLINQFGYDLLQADRVQDAIRVFEYNVARYPDSWNVYDSLGEALAAAGRIEEALANYERSVGLNPNNGNGRRYIRQLRQLYESTF